MLLDNGRQLEAWKFLQVGGQHQRGERNQGGERTRTVRGAKWELVPVEGGVVVATETRKKSKEEVVYVGIVGPIREPDTGKGLILGANVLECIEMFCEE